MLTGSSFTVMTGRANEREPCVSQPDPVVWSAEPAPRPAPALARAASVAALSASAGNQAVCRALDRQAGARERGRQLARFGSAEHQAIGADASGSGSTDLELGNGEMLPYGDMVALAGDYFKSLQQMRELAATPAGQAQLRAARYKALGFGTKPDPATEKLVMDRYFELAGANVSHFAAGGDALISYRDGHKTAIESAFMAGAAGDDRKFLAARTEEAFCNHYLTDMFAGGHVRTPRRDIQDWYQSKYPDSLDRLLDWASLQIARVLDGWHQTNSLPNSKIAAKLRTKIEELGGPAVKTFSLGDIVGLAYHHHDNQGLGVVSKVDERGNEVAGGYRWKAEGDNRLIPPGGKPPTADAALTRRMVTAATRASLKDLDDARTRGKEAAGGGVVPAAQLVPLAEKAAQALVPLRAEDYIPDEDPDAGNAKMEWEWGRLDPALREAVDESIKSEIVGTLRGKSDAVPEFTYLKFIWHSPWVTEMEAGADVRKADWTLHTRAAFLDWVGELAGLGITGLELAMDSTASPPSDDEMDAGAKPLAGAPAGAGAPSGVP